MQIRAAERDGMQRNTAVGPNTADHSDRAEHDGTSEYSGELDQVGVTERVRDANERTPPSGRFLLPRS